MIGNPRSFRTGWMSKLPLLVMMQFVARFWIIAITTEVVGCVSFDNLGYPSNPYQLSHLTSCISEILHYRFPVTHSQKRSPQADFHLHPARFPNNCSPT